MDKIISNIEDTKKFIEFVRRMPQIYASPRLNVRLRSICWTAIAIKFDGKFSAAECRRKWKSLKDSYKKYLKQRMNGRRSLWIYAKDLDFMYQYCINEMSSAARRRCNDFRQLQNGSLVLHATLAKLLPETITKSEVIDAKSSKLNCDLKDFYDFSEFGIDSVGNSLQTVAESTPVNQNTDVEMPSELDNFFDFLKNRVQSLTKEQIPEAQVKLMACVLSIEQSF